MSKEWMAIVVFDFSNGTRPIAILDEDLEAVALFESRDEIVAMSKRHFLKAGEWYAFNFITGEMEEL